MKSAAFQFQFMAFVMDVIHGCDPSNKNASLAPAKEGQVY